MNLSDEKRTGGEWMNIQREKWDVFPWN